MKLGDLLMENMTEELGHCASCHRHFPKSQLHPLTDEDRQGYEPPMLVCHQCLEDIRAESFVIEDEDIYDLEEQVDSEEISLKIGTTSNLFSIESS